MDIEKKKRFNWLIIVSVLLGGTGCICLGLAFFFISFYDSPIGGVAAGMGAMDSTLIGSVFAFPITCLVAALGVLLLRKRTVAALIVTLLPGIPLVLIFAIFGWTNFTSCGSVFCQTSGIQGPVSNIQAAECGTAVVDGGDGLVTTSCGELQSGVVSKGKTGSTSEAQNWQFSAQAGKKVTISIESGASCPQIKILDSAGSLVDGFEDENSLHFCPSGMISTSFFYFVPPADGTYIIRLITPKQAGSYKLKITSEY
jgi:hypothetical protein